MLKCNTCGIEDNKTDNVIISKLINKYKFEISFPNKSFPNMSCHQEDLYLCNNCYKSIVNDISSILDKYRKY